MSRLYYFRSSSRLDLHAFTEDVHGGILPYELGPWVFLRTVAPAEGWTAAAEITSVEAGITANGFFLADAPGELTFDESPVRPGD
jgi:hypothetical protein